MARIFQTFKLRDSNVLCYDSFLYSILHVLRRRWRRPLYDRAYQTSADRLFIHLSDVSRVRQHISLHPQEIAVTAWYSTELATAVHFAIIQGGLKQTVLKFLTRVYHDIEKRSVFRDITRCSSAASLSTSMPLPEKRIWHWRDLDL